ncbi:MAG: tetratricopeptide repeat protein [Bacteroidetes bacterium]|nr:tetratricopeptide repeat protein [Bacteroidota bacterium]
MRSFEELNAATKHARSIGDVAALQQCAEELEALGMPEADALAANARGVACRFHEDYATALEHFLRALALYDASGDIIGAADVTASIGGEHLKMGNIASALEYCHRALALYEELGDPVGVVRTTINIGNVHVESGGYALALEHYHRALEQYERLGNRSGVAGASSNIGGVHFRTGNSPLALECYHRALALFEDLGERVGMADAIGGIGNVHYRTGNTALALENYERALALYNELDVRNGVAHMTNNIGGLHRNTGNYALALEHYRRAHTIYEELGNRAGVAVAAGIIVSTLILAGEHVEAEVQLHAMDAMQIDDPLDIVSREESRASLQEHHGNIDGARATLGAALRIAQEHSLALEQAGIHRSLRDLALKRNDLAGYVEHNNEFTRILEEVNGKEATLKVTMQEQQREIDAVQREHQKHLAVLHSTLPKHVAERVARGEVVNDHFDNATVIFLDIVGFTELSSTMSSQEVITLLDDVFTQCDAICKQHNVVKIKTIGDSYMCVSFDSVIPAAHCALDMSRISISHEVSHAVSHVVEFRIGIHCGPVTAGVIGKERMQYDVWGDTVNVASRMESTGEAGRVHVSEAFAVQLEEALVTRHLSLVTQLRGSFDIKGKGPMNTYWLEDRRG